MGFPTEAQRNEGGNQTKYHRVSKWCVAAQKPQVGAMRVLSPQNRGITAFAMVFIKPTTEIVVARYTAYKRSSSACNANTMECITPYRY